MDGHMGQISRLLTRENESSKITMHREIARKSKLSKFDELVISFFLEEDVWFAEAKTCDTLRVQSTENPQFLLFFFNGRVGGGGGTQYSIIENYFESPEK